MAKVVIGGQMLSLVLALLVTPVMYSLIDSLNNRIRRLFGRPPVSYVEDAAPAEARV
jgi:HAE1 family hydrophobic/amphiphilic exporter-1